MAATDAAATPTPLQTPSRTPLPTRLPGLAAFDTLVERARPVTYNQLLADPERFEGALLHFRGRVRQVTDDEAGRFETSLSVGGRELLIVYFAETYFGHPLVRGDNVRFVGTFVGLGAGQSGERVPVVEIIELIIRFT